MEMEMEMRGGCGTEVGKGRYGVRSTRYGVVVNKYVLRTIVWAAGCGQRAGGRA